MRAADVAQRRLGDRREERVDVVATVDAFGGDEQNVRHVVEVRAGEHVLLAQHAPAERPARRRIPNLGDRCHDLRPEEIACHDG